MIGVIISAALLVPGSSCYVPPVRAPVVDPFRAPACAYCPGNRGLEYRPGAGAAVVAAAQGVVRFSGVVAGVRYVVVDQPDGRRATYGYLDTVTVGVGQAVVAGQAVGTSTARLYFGVRVGDVYIDPAPLLGVWHARVRLVPTDGSARRRGPPPVLRCASRGGDR